MLKRLLFVSREKLNSMNLLLYMAPIAVVFLLPATLYMEENVVGITLALARSDIKIIWYLLFNSALAYFVNLTNFLVTKHTSALTLQVCLAITSYFPLHFGIYILLDMCSQLKASFFFLSNLRYTFCFTTNDNIWFDIRRYHFDLNE